MNGFERVAVLIDESKTGRNLLLYVRELSRLQEIREISLLHVIPYQPPASMVAMQASGSAYWVSQDSLKKQEELRAAKRKELELLAREVLPSDAPYTFRTTVLSGSPLYDTLDYTFNESTDLLVVGRHYADDSQTDEQAVMAQRLTRKSACSVLVLPEYNFALPTRLLVPVRDSDCSALALDLACRLAAPTDGLVFALNLYSTRGATGPSGVSEHQESDIPEKLANEENARLRERVDSHGVYVEYICQADPDNRPEDKMLEAVERTNAHAVVIGARGRTGAAGVLLGKVTQRLIAHATVPVFAVKKKGEMIGVVTAVLELSRKSRQPKTDLEPKTEEAVAHATEIPTKS